MKVNILGTKYTITVKRYDKDEAFARLSIDGYCNSLTRRIVVCNIATHPYWEHESPEAIEAAQKEVLRHEIIHAFLSESGLSDSSNTLEIGWDKNEEMVDWFALQGQKIYKVWQEVGAL